MTLLDDAVAEQRGPGMRCVVSHLAAADPELYAELVEALGSDVTAAAISRALQKRGHKISQLTVSRHRNGQCSSCR